MNSITVVVHKLSPSSTPLHDGPNHPQSSSSTLSARPDSGYFSIYSDQEDAEVIDRGDTLLRRRQVDSSLGTTNIFNEKLRPAGRNVPSSNIAMRTLITIFNAITDILWALLY